MNHQHRLTLVGAKISGFFSHANIVENCKNLFELLLHISIFSIMIYCVIELDGAKQDKKIVDICPMRNYKKVSNNVKQSDYFIILSEQWRHLTKVLIQL